MIFNNVNNLLLNQNGNSKQLLWIIHIAQVRIHKQGVKTLNFLLNQNFITGLWFKSKVVSTQTY